MHYRAVPALGTVRQNSGSWLDPHSCLQADRVPPQPAGIRPLELLYEKDDVVLVLIGEYGYSTVGLYGKFETAASFLEPVKGRRIYFPSRFEPHEDAGPYQRPTPSSSALKAKCCTSIDSTTPAGLPSNPDARGT